MASYVRPTIGVVTAIGTQHIALFGSAEALFEAKSELVLSLPENGVAILNGDNPGCREMKSLAPCPAVVVGTGGICDLEAFDIEETPEGIRFTADRVTFDVPLHGTHNVSNVLLALAAGKQLRIKMERMRDHLKRFLPLSKTFQLRKQSGITILDDTHNASAASLKAAIAWARTRPEARKVLLTSGLIEMGEFQENAERELGALASDIFERIIVASPISARNFAMDTPGKVELLTKQTSPIDAGTLLVCSGRMPATTITRLLP
jgi:UDP-N-acetylmuramoyl-tripeptide--D-alanyl-D-alanine ligase